MYRYPVDIFKNVYGYAHDVAPFFQQITRAVVANTRQHNTTSYDERILDLYLKLKLLFLPVLFRLAPSLDAIKGCIRLFQQLQKGHTTWLFSWGIKTSSGPGCCLPQEARHSLPYLTVHQDHTLYKWGLWHFQSFPDHYQPRTLCIPYTCLYPMPQSPALYSTRPHLSGFYILQQLCLSPLYLLSRSRLYTRPSAR